jgi:hypothetical protein
MQELNLVEVASVAGAGPLSSLVGSAIIGGIAFANDLADSRLGSLPGKLVDEAGLNELHFAVDAVAYAIYKGIDKFGESLGGAGNPNYHFENQWGSAPLL